MSDRLKEIAARKAVEYVRDGMVVGLGTGSSAAFAIRALGERVVDGLSIQAVATSEASRRLGEELGLDVQSLEDHPIIDLTIDGADEVDPQLELIKGLGGALLREKIVARASTREIIVVDPSKLVERLGTHSPLPVEVAPFGWAPVQRQLAELALTVERRQTVDGETFVTDNGNYILDCRFERIDDPGALDQRVNAITGVVENGLFVGLADTVIVAHENGSCDIRERER